MSQTDMTRQTRALLKRSTAQLSGRERGPDHGENRRVPRRHSYDVEDPRARRWTPIGDGSVAYGLAHREALFEAAEEQYHQGWRDHPLRAQRDDRARRMALSAELDELTMPDATLCGTSAKAR